MTLTFLLVSAFLAGVFLSTPVKGFITSLLDIVKKLLD